MTQSVLILGASGRFGRNSAEAFRKAGWQVRLFDRARNDLKTATRDVDVVVNAWNPPDYSHWAKEILPLHRRVIDALRGTDITVIVPGNVYVFGPETPAPWAETSPHRATNPLGRLRIEMEQAYAASGVRTILLRGGDFLDTAPSGNWFDAIMIKKLAKGRFTYPGDLDALHAWAYLPDMARAAVSLAEKRGTLPTYADIPFPGYTLTAHQIADHLEHVIGRPVQARRMACWPLQIGQHVAPFLKGLVEMRYLWRTPHSLHGSRFDALLPGFEQTPPQVALAQTVAHLPGLSVQRKIDPDQAVTV